MKRNNFMTDKELIKYADEMAKFKYKCKCGHSVVIPDWVDKQLCRCCNNYVFKNKKDEDMYRIKEKLK